jgi:hypothetical protein
LTLSHLANSLGPLDDATDRSLTRTSASFTKVRISTNDRNSHTARNPSATLCAGNGRHVLSLLCRDSGLRLSAV